MLVYVFYYDINDFLSIFFLFNISYSSGFKYIIGLPDSIYYYIFLLTDLLGAHDIKFSVVVSFSLHNEKWTKQFGKITSI